MDATEKTSRGGSRKGSGRPQIATHRTSVTLTDEIVEAARELGKNRKGKGNVSEGIRRAVLHAVKCEKFV
jgi:hypothetical protein